MTHELKKIVQAYQAAKAENINTILATVVALEGSSYRRPGVRMLIREDGTMIGAVSGGCVEKEVLRQAESVFGTGKAKMMTYDGRYRLGCEGILYILIEPFNPSNNLLSTFWEVIEQRTEFQVASHYVMKDGSYEGLGSVVHFEKEEIPLRKETETRDDHKTFTQTLSPCFQLMIIGAEHDAVQLCYYAALTGWEVHVIASPMEEKSIEDFPGANKFTAVAAEELEVDKIDPQTAVMLMTHSYVKDFKRLIALKDSHPVYLGLLGPSARREKLLNEFLEHAPEVSDVFMERVHGPAGLNVGAETPQEIAISIIAEILSVVRAKQPILLKNKKGAIHS